MKIQYYFNTKEVILRNHLVPQFYLRYFLSNQGQINYFDTVHHVFGHKPLIGIAQLSNTYSDELEKKFSKYESGFSKTYEKIVDKLLKTNPTNYKMPILSLEDYDYFQEYIFVQMYRTINGRINLRRLMGHIKKDYPLSLDNLRIEAEKADEILLNMPFKDIYIKATDKSKPVMTFFRTFKNENLFWTSSNPAVLINIFSLHNPTHDIESDNTDFNSIYFPITPHLAVLLIPPELKGHCPTIDTFIDFNNRMIPLDKYESEESVKKMIRGMNWSLMAYMDLLDTYTKKKTTENISDRDIRNYHFYLISKRFSETEKNYLEKGLGKIEKRSS